MICQKVGCGRYKNADAYKHYQASGHFLAYDATNQRIWNYLEDCFSHRIVSMENKSILKFPEIAHHKQVAHSQHRDEPLQ